jgi:GT2 family glycosyltransferase
MDDPVSVRADISVVICAYAEERWADMLAAIESVAQQTLPPREIVLVIDHNPKLFKRVQEAVKDVVVVENHFSRGLSGGRNTGIAVSKGQFIAFLDDDAQAAPDWLEKMAAWFQYDEVVGVGGAVDPNWEGEAPQWFPNEFRWVVGCSYRGLPQTSSVVRNLFGGCMCIRRKAFEVAGGFRSSIGRGDGRPMGCEETELCIRVHQKQPGWQFVYEPKARIYHRVPVARLNWNYFRQRCYAEGLSKAQVSQLVGASDGLSSERSYTFQTLPSGVLNGLVDTLSGRDGWGVARAGAIVAGLGYTMAGYAVGMMGQMFVPKPKKEEGLVSG